MHLEIGDDTIGFLLVHFVTDDKRVVGAADAIVRTFDIVVPHHAPGGSGSNVVKPLTDAPKALRNATDCQRSR